MSSLFDDLTSYIDTMLKGPDDFPTFEDERGKHRPRGVTWLLPERHEDRQVDGILTSRTNRALSRGSQPASSGTKMQAGKKPPKQAKAVKFAPTGLAAVGFGQSPIAVNSVLSAAPTVQSVFRPAGKQTDPISVFAKVAALAIANADDEQDRRRGGGSVGPDQGGAGNKKRISSAKSSWRPDGQGIAARAAIAAGAQPAVFKVISSASTAASAGALLQYLGTREGEDGRKQDIEIFTHAGETLNERGERCALLEEWKEDFREPFQTTNFIEVTFTVSADLSREDQHQGLNAAFGGKPFVYARDGETVKVFAHTEMKAAGLAKALHGNGAGGALNRAEAALTARIEGAGVSANAKITAAVSTERQAQYFLQKFIRANPQLIKSDGDDLKVLQRADKAAAELYGAWKSDFKTIEPRNVYHVLFSARAGTDPKAMLEAARNHLSEQIPDHKWVIAHHPETKHVHVHAIILARSELGGQLRFAKPELYEWRENFAEKAREQGIAMVATSRMDLAASRPFNARQAGAYERSKRETRYSVGTTIVQRVEAKRAAVIETKSLVANGTAIAAAWQTSAAVLHTEFPGSAAVQSAEGFSATIIDMASKGHDVAKLPRPQALPAPTHPETERQTGMFADMIKEMTTMALTPTEYRQKMVNINKSFDEMAETLPDPKAREALNDVRAEFNEFMNERLDEIRVQRAEEVSAAGAAARAHSRSLKEKAEQTKTQDRAHEIAPSKNGKPQQVSRSETDKQKKAEQAKASDDQDRKSQRSRDDDERER